MCKRLVIFAGIFISVTVMALQGQYQILHWFSRTEGCPTGSLSIKNNTLYGMSSGGGAYNVGTIFKIGLDGAGFALLHSFEGSSDGDTLRGSLVFYDGKLYGMTPLGGAGNVGVIFRINMDGTGFTVLHSFSATTTDGFDPIGSLILYDGQFYGTTQHGGASGRGTVFRISPRGGGFKIIHSFAGGATDGSFPLGTLTLVGTRLFGTTSGGGANDNGTLFRILPGGAGFKVLHSFAGGPLDGSLPLFGALASSGPWLFGTTSAGGPDDRGTIFRIKTDGSEYALLHSLGPWEGMLPMGSVIFSGSKLYGMSYYGGDLGCGTIFVINADGTGFETLHSFDYSFGAFPFGDPLRVVTNKYGTMLYGTTNTGSGGNGLIFSYKLK